MGYYGGWPESDGCMFLPADKRLWNSFTATAQILIRSSTALADGFQMLASSVCSNMSWLTGSEKTPEIM